MITQTDLQKAIAEEVSKFLEEHREEILRRAMEKLKTDQGKEAKDNAKVP